MSEDKFKLDTIESAIRDIRDGKVVIGATGDDDNGSASGSVYVYDADGTNQLKITPSGGVGGDGFGRRVAIGDGKIVVGGPFADPSSQTNAGKAWIFDVDGSNQVSWIYRG